MINTQVRGRLVQAAMNDMAWEDIPTDGLQFKEYDEPTISQNNKEDEASKSKPNIRSTIRNYRELKEEKYEDEYDYAYSFMTNSEFDRLQPEGYTPTKYTTDSSYLPNDSNATPETRTSARSRRSKNSQDNEKYRTNTKDNKKSSRSKEEAKSTQKTEQPEYMMKLAKALETKSTKGGKLKFSQKLSFPASSTFACKKIKLSDPSQQLSTIVAELDEDIENFENLDPKGMYSSSRSHKKVKVDVNKNSGNSRNHSTNPQNDKSSATSKNQGQGSENGKVIRVYKKIDLHSATQNKKPTPSRLT